MDAGAFGHSRSRIRLRIASVWCRYNGCAPIWCGVLGAKAGPQRCDGAMFGAVATGTLRQALRSGLFPRRHERLESDPSPIDPMMGDESVGNIHHFNKIDLIALRGCARILPCQLPAVGKERPGSIPAAEFVAELAEAGLEERPDRGLSPARSLRSCPARSRGSTAFRGWHRRRTAPSSHRGHRRRRSRASARRCEGFRRRAGSSWSQSLRVRRLHDGACARGDVSGLSETCRRGDLVGCFVCDGEIVERVCAVVRSLRSVGLLFDRDHSFASATIRGDAAERKQKQIVS